MSKEVTCIKKRGNHHAEHERISAIGGKKSSGTSWSMSEEDAIRAIEEKKEEFYVNVNRREINVIVATHNGRKYLKTTADGYSPNNLLNLDECP
jgi:hypothetical protein